RSIKSAKAGLVEADYMDLINFEASSRYDAKQKAALSYAEAITWDLPTDDAFWARLHAHFSEPELVEIGYFIATTMGQQR
ncbi:carboxymuconolactone decarboxylase, partial [Rhodoplanes serenus]